MPANNFRPYAATFKASLSLCWCSCSTRRTSNNSPTFSKRHPTNYHRCINAFFLNFFCVCVCDLNTRTSADTVKKGRNACVLVDIITALGEIHTFNDVPIIIIMKEVRKSRTVSAFIHLAFNQPAHYVIFSIALSFLPYSFTSY